MMLRSNRGPAAKGDHKTFHPRPWVAGLALAGGVGLGLSLILYHLQDPDRLTAVFQSPALDSALAPLLFFVLPGLVLALVYLVVRRIGPGLATLMVVLVLAVGTSLFGLYLYQMITGTRLASILVAATGSVLILVILWVFRRYLVPAYAVLALAILGLSGWHWYRMDTALTRAHPPASRSVADIGRGRDVPVFIIVFDEISAFILRDADGRIDRRLYPHFARLADQATWYVNMTVGRRNCPVTGQSMLSGLDLARRFDQYDINCRVPARTAPNILTVLAPSRRLHISEAWKHLARTTPELGGPSVRLGLGPRAVLAYAWRALKDYLRALMHPDWLRPFSRPSYIQRPPVNPPSWQGVPRARYLSVWDGLFLYEEYRKKKVLSEISTDPRAFYFYYNRFSHFPYLLGPDGSTIYFHPPARSRRNSPPRESRQFRPDSRPDRGETSANLRRSYINQMRYADRVLGQILATIRDKGLFDRALIIIASDHGVAFTGRAAGNWLEVLRPFSDQLAALMMNNHTLLIVKYPGQKKGRRDRRPARPQDVAPTILEVLGLGRPWPMDGVSLRSARWPTRNLVFYPQVKGDGLAWLAGVNFSGIEVRDVGLPDEYRFPITPTRPVATPWLGVRVDRLKQSRVRGGYLVSVAREKTLPGSGAGPEVLTLTGISMPPAGRPVPDLALIAVNGTIVKAVRPTQHLPGIGPAGWTVVVPAAHLKAGGNRLRAFSRDPDNPDCFREMKNSFVLSLSPAQLAGLKGGARR